MNGGGRNCSQCFVIVITDGRPKADNNITAATEADRIRNERNCIVYVVSVAQANSTQLEIIAGGPSNVFNETGFALLISTIKAVVQAVCNDSKCSK